MFYRWFQRLRNGRAKSKVNHEVICGTAHLLVPSLSLVALAAAALAFWKVLISLYGPVTHQGSSW